LIESVAHPVSRRCKLRIILSIATLGPDFGNHLAIARDIDRFPASTLAKAADVLALNSRIDMTPMACTPKVATVAT
jgi:hypothetical protein